MSNEDRPDASVIGGGLCRPGKSARSPARLRTQSAWQNSSPTRMPLSGEGAWHGHAPWPGYGGRRASLIL